MANKTSEPESPIFKILGSVSAIESTLDVKVL